MTQFALANEILTLGLDMISNGITTARVREIMTLYKILTEIEVVPVPARIFDKLIVNSYNVDRESTVKAWCEAGKTLAAYIKAMFGSLNNISSLLPYLSDIFPSKKFEVKLTEDEFDLNIVGLGYSAETVEANAAALRCLLEDLGYKIEELITAPGLLKAKAKKVG
ncbi:hypothetical protein TUZN_1084 [Thermoproteus uzoniensis 768-20]|uniref:Uncharacterized protein n=2 Tax=Thermoproteus TaxID=2270 RepID=F2L082_THEU7|nr:hypothetical protein TUZN_1084 [Thermoproteus uzoniensis 768-20]